MKPPFLGRHHPLLSQLEVRLWGHGRVPAHSPPSSLAGGSRFRLKQPVPAGLQGDGWLLRPLQMETAILTYEAYLTCPHLPLSGDDCCHEVAAYTWPDHMQRVEQLEQAQRSHRQFAYAILDAAGSRCLGCVLLRPIRPFLSRYQAPNHLLVRTSDNTAMVTFGLCHTLRQRPQRLALVRALHRWFLSAWEFDDHFFRLDPDDDQTVTAVEAAGLQPHFWMDVPLFSTHYVFYGAAAG